MRHFRRMTLEIERRMARLSLDTTDSARTTKAEGSEGICEQCGSALVLLHDASTCEQTGLRSMLEAIGLHAHMSPAGHLFLCQQSFQQLLTQEREEKP